MISPPRIPELPNVTHAQFFVLETLMVCPFPAKDLRAELEEFGWLRHDRTFTDLTRRLEELGYVAVYETEQTVGVFAVPDRYYEITVAGVRAYHQAFAFYTNGAAAAIGK